MVGHRLSKIYTRTGDDGSTGLGDGSRTEKDSLRIEAIGTVDELNAVLGIVLAGKLPEDIRTCLVKIQHQLFNLGGELCMPDMQLINQQHVDALEHMLDSFNESLPPLKDFILPGGTVAAANCHLARTIARRSERRVISLAKAERINDTAGKYLNRLSDLLFVIARQLARQDGGNEVLWEHEYSE